jgi:beta-N-acetylhexosaminidase
MQLWQARVGVVGGESAGGESAAGEGADTGGARVDADEALTALADDSLTVLAGECTFEDPADSIAVSGGSEDARAAFTDAAEAAGLTVEEGAGVTVSLGAGAGADVVVGTSGPWNVEDSGADTIVEVYDGNPASYTAVRSGRDRSRTRRGVLGRSGLRGGLRAGPRIRAFIP